MAFRLQLSSALGLGRNVFTKLKPMGFSAAHNTLAGIKHSARATCFVSYILRLDQAKNNCSCYDQRRLAEASMGVQTSDMAEMGSVLANIALDELQWQYSSDTRPQVGRKEPRVSSSGVSKPESLPVD